MKNKSEKIKNDDTMSEIKAIFEQIHNNINNIKDAIKRYRY